MDSKKIIGVVVGIVLILTIILVFIFNPFKKDDTNIDDSNVNTINTTEQDLNEEANNMPELTEEQNEIFDEIVGKPSTEDSNTDIEIISTPDDQDPDTQSPELVYKDEQGNIIHEEISMEEWNMTDEEAEEEMRRMEEEMNQMLKDYENNKAAHDRGENTLTPNNTVDEGTFISTEDTSNPDIYYGYGSYDAMIDAICKKYPNLSREEIMDRNPDLAGLHVNKEAAADDAAKGLLTGN